METFCRITIQLPLFQLKLKTVPLCNVKQVTHILELGQYLGCLDRRP